MSALVNTFWATLYQHLMPLFMQCVPLSVLSVDKMLLKTRNLANIGPGNGLLPDGTKPLPQPMLANHQ